MQNKNETKLLDMGECAALIVLGFNLTRMENSHTNRYKIFIIEGDKDEITTHLESYRCKNLEVNAYKYWMAIKEIKKRIADSNALDSEV